MPGEQLLAGGGWGLMGDDSSLSVFLDGLGGMFHAVL